MQVTQLGQESGRCSNGVEIIDRDAGKKGMRLQLALSEERAL